MSSHTVIVGPAEPTGPTFGTLQERDAFAVENRLWFKLPATCLNHEAEIFNAESPGGFHAFFQDDCPVIKANVFVRWWPSP